mmetsp:Transcript_98068/g.293021  ORF Transcript_98068/g.293021 Transcript_98068/m.293021 type:complete len:204 (-) Transcript_98068:477-1088(-)
MRAHPRLVLLGAQRVRVGPHALLADVLPGYDRDLAMAVVAAPLHNAIPERNEAVVLRPGDILASIPVHALLLQQPRAGLHRAALVAVLRETPEVRLQAVALVLGTGRGLLVGMEDERGTCTTGAAPPVALRGASGEGARGAARGRRGAERRRGQADNCLRPLVSGRVVGEPRVVGVGLRALVQVEGLAVRIPLLVAPLGAGDA